MTGQKKFIRDLESPLKIYSPRVMRLISRRRHGAKSTGLTSFCPWESHGGTTDMALEVPSDYVTCSPCRRTHEG